MVARSFGGPLIFWDLSRPLGVAVVRVPVGVRLSFILRWYIC
jgi:hypothetical protein